MLRSDDVFYQYWREMLESANSGAVSDFFELENVSFVDRNNCTRFTKEHGPRCMYVRSCYAKLADRIINQTSANAVVTGTSGVGKTMFRNYFVRKLFEFYLQKKANFSVALDYLPGALTIAVFCGTFDNNGELSWSAFEYDRMTYFTFSQTQRSELWYLMDVCEGNSSSKIVNGSRSVMFTSPNERAYREFLKENCLLYYMPLWTLSEAERWCAHMKWNHKSTLMERWTKYGGIVRILNQTDEEFQQYDLRVRNSIGSISSVRSYSDTISLLSAQLDVGDRIFYYEVDSNFRGSLCWATVYVRNLVVQLYSHSVRHDLGAVLNDLYDSSPQSIVCSLLEHLALELISLGDTSFVQCKLDTERNNLQLTDPLEFGSLTPRYIAGGLDGFLTFLRDYGETRAVMAIPNISSFPCIDAVIIDTDAGGQRVYYFLQVSISKRDRISTPHASIVFADIIKFCGGPKQCVLLHVLPNNEVYRDFACQVVPKYDNWKIAQYKIAPIRSRLLYDTCMCYYLCRTPPQVAKKQRIGRIDACLPTDVITLK